MTSTVPPAIIDLVERFKTHRDAYRSGHYNETQVRREFIDPFFEALGWDMNNRQGIAEPYKDVVHEDSIQIEGGAKAPDYGFRIGGARRFFVEAKKPSVNIFEGIPAAYQLRRYAWSAKLPLSILTDFEEFAIYDCRGKPAKTDKPATGRILYMGYPEYPARWDEIASVFSREAVLNGSFDKYAEATRAKHGTAEVDDAFLAEIERWRDLLARSIALRNPSLSQREMNYAVQMTIDRIIFLRICEDRGIESYGQLMALLNGGDVYPRMVQLFHQADARFDSGLFHFHDEKGQSDAPDRLTPNLVIDDAPLKDLLRSIYYPDSPYAFQVLPADILGQVYEQFLGKVIRLTDAHRAVVEDKPEVKKAGGVFYTPTYIVDYIVRNTLGKLLEGKTPGDKGAGKGTPLRVLDPACGSGSFLLGAYQYLLDWYRDGYIAAGPQKALKGKTPPLYQTPSGEWRLTTAERKRILLDHIYGVDIDPQAVEVTKLSLLLKVLEGESEESLAPQLRLFQERALPNLGRNIQCGNSLIGPDFYDGAQASLLDPEEQYRVNAFDWHKCFEEVFKTSGGFDAVIGNPPYIRIQTMKEWAPVEVEFYKKAYISASKGNYDIYVVFVEKGLSLLNEQGRLGFILPHKFFNSHYGEPLRGLIARGRYLAGVVHFGDQQVFESASTYTCLMFLNKKCTESFGFQKVDDLNQWQMELASFDQPKEIAIIPSPSEMSGEWNFVMSANAGLLEKLQGIPTKLEDVTDRIFQGIKTSADKIYILKELYRDENKVKVVSAQTQSEYWLEPDLLHPLIKGGDSKRYQLNRTKRLILFPYGSENDSNVILIPEAKFKRVFPLTWAYLLDNKSYLENREDGKMKGSRWYGYVYPKALDVMALPKIFTPDIANHSSFSLDETGEIFFTGGVSGGYGILVNPKYNREYILGLLNSKVLEWYIHQTASSMRGGYFSYESRFIRSLPIRTMNLEEPNQKEQHDRMIVLVQTMLDLHKQLAAARTPGETTHLQRQVESTDRQIDRLVYDLYGLTEEEIQIVEGENPSLGKS